MRFQIILSKVDDILKYRRKKRKKKLYRQWVETSGLPSEAIPEEELAGDIMPEIDKNKLRLKVLYISLSASIMIFCTGLILLIINSC
ncbi:hypothetical protein ACFLUD_03705 [Chloroflexota bacterium]